MKINADSKHYLGRGVHLHRAAVSLTLGLGPRVCIVYCSWFVSSRILVHVWFCLLMFLSFCDFLPPFQYPVLMVVSCSLSLFLCLYVLYVQVCFPCLVSSIEFT